MTERAQGAAFEVGEIENVARGFFIGEHAVEPARRVRDTAEEDFAFAQLEQRVPRRTQGGEGIERAVDGLFCGVAQVAERLFDFGVAVLGLRRFAGERGLLRVKQGAGGSFCFGAKRRKTIVILLRERFVHAVQLAEGKHAAESGPRAAELLRGLCAERVRPGRIEQSGFVAIIPLQRRGEPFPRIGAREQKIVQRVDGRFKLLARHAQRGVCKAGRGFVVERFERIGQRRLFQQRNFRPFAYAVHRVDLRGLEIPATDLSAEAVQRGDIGALDAQRLFAQPFLIKAVEDTGAHFRGRRAREGHNEHAVERNAFLCEGDDAGGEDGGFAAACCGGDEQVASAGGDRFLLSGSVVHRDS